MKKVIILGGGVAGMSAAHELIERGYAVEVYDRNTTYVGGKARSIDYTGNPNNPYINPLPAEHGFRFFPGFYKHVIDTMQRIPFTNADGKKASVFENLTATSRIMVARYGKEPIVVPATFPRNFSDIQLLIKDMHGADSGLSHTEEKFFAERVWQLITSSIRRRNNDYERLGWWQYLEADRFANTDGTVSPYQSLLVQGLTRTLVAARAETASTKTGGNVFLQLLFSMTDPSVNTDRVLDGPTNERWLTAWKEYLIGKGVSYTLGADVIAMQMSNTNASNGLEKIVNASIKMPDGSTKIPKGDYYILAVPVERAAALINDDMIKADKTLEYIKTLAPSVSWMNGIQFYLNEEVNITNGHIIYSDSEWAITSISQTQFWKDYDITTKGNGDIKGVLSVDISDWFSKGLKNKKCADDCTRQEVANEVWEQLKHSLNINGKEILKDSMLVDWFLDRDIEENLSIHDATKNCLSNREPLLVNNVNTWGLRPDASCDIENLFFASDYVRTFTDLATMEGANEAARRAVNCLLDADGSNASKCKIWPLHEPALFGPLRWYDQRRWNNGLPWTMHIPWWLKAIMIPWGICCVVAGFFQLIIKKIFR